MSSVPANPLARRVEALAEGARLCRDRCAAELVEAADAVVARAGARVAFSGTHTVVALAGATGSGKSSLFNAITGTQLARVAVTRPTTAEAMAVSWGTQQPHDLLDWLEIPRRHLIPSSPTTFTDLILLDLPDHDSTEVSHRLTVDRLVKLVDTLFWVVDPQKYADAALHDRYLKPLAPYADVMTVVLNQADRLAPEDLARCRADLRRLLDSEGLAATPILAVSAVTGSGMTELREALARLVAGKQAMTKRLSADIDVVAGTLAQALGPNDPPQLTRRVVTDLGRALADAAGAPIVSESVLRAWRRRGAAATGWPFVSWIPRLKPDPLRRLRLDAGPRDPRPTTINRTSLPPASPVQKARVDRALRELDEAATPGLPREWAQAIRSLTKGQERRLLDRLDAAIAGADLPVGRGARWWPWFTAVQWVSMLAVVAGAAWLASGPLLAYLQLPPLPQVSWYQIPAPTWLLGGGVLAGLLLAGLGRLLVEAGARRRAGQTARILAEAVERVAQEEVVGRLQAELDRFQQARAALRRARS